MTTAELWDRMVEEAADAIFHSTSDKVHEVARASLLAALKVLADNPSEEMVYAAAPNESDRACFQMMLDELIRTGETK